LPFVAKKRKTTAGAPTASSATAISATAISATATTTSTNVVSWAPFVQSYKLCHTYAAHVQVVEQILDWFQPDPVVGGSVDSACLELIQLVCQKMDEILSIPWTSLEATHIHLLETGLQLMINTGFTKAATMHDWLRAVSVGSLVRKIWEKGLANTTFRKKTQR
jgi:hypothetical protein